MSPIPVSRIPMPKSDDAGVRSPRAIAALVVMSLVALASSASAQVRVMSWNVARLGGDANAVEAVFAAAAADDLPGFATAPALIALQEVPSSIAGTLVALVNSGIPGANYATATYTSSGSENNAGGAQMLIYRTDLFTEIPSGHRDIFTGAGRDCDRWQLRLNGSTDAAGVVWVYSMHLKASNTAEDAEIRHDGAIAVRNDGDNRPAGSNIIYLGDFNVYDNDEEAYLEFLSPGSGIAEDPLGSGDWGGPSNAIKHTQSPRLNGGDLVGGGMDDRFDLQLYSPGLLDGAGLSVLSDSYRAFGNDGDHYNGSINSGNNFYFPGEIARSNQLADDLFDASDHIPVLCDLQVPGQLSCLLTEDLGRVVSGGSASINVLVANSRQAASPDVVDDVAYVVAGDGTLVGGDTGVAPLLPSFAVVPLALAGELEGSFAATVSVTSSSPGVSQPNYTLQASGTAIRPAVASWSAKVASTSRTVSETAEPDSGVVFIDVPVFNLRWDAGQSALDLDSISGLASGFFNWDGLGSSVTDAGGLLRFGLNTDGLADGLYAVDLLVQGSDEDVPGETTHTLELRLEVEIDSSGDGVFGDLTGDDRVNGADLGQMLGSWGICVGCPADLDGSGRVDGSDLGLILGAWLPCADVPGRRSHGGRRADAVGRVETTERPSRATGVLQGVLQGVLRERPRWDSNPRITDLQSVPLDHLGTRPGPEVYRLPATTPPAFPGVACRS